MRLRTAVPGALAHGYSPASKYRAVVHLYSCECCDLIENRILSAEDTRHVAAFQETGKNFQTYCCVWDGQFLFADIQSVYNRNDIRIKMTVTVTAQHPTMDEGIIIAPTPPILMKIREVLSERYITQAGIPVLIVTVMEDYYRRDNHRAMLDCFAFFAVDNISYTVEPRA